MTRQRLIRVLALSAERLHGITRLVF